MVVDGTESLHSNDARWNRQGAVHIQGTDLVQYSRDVENRAGNMWSDFSVWSSHGEIHIKGADLVQYSRVVVNGPGKMRLNFSV
jgi:hypothetical protein